MRQAASAIFAILIHDLTVTFRDKSALIWVFVGPALCMALAGFLTSPRAGNVPVLKVVGNPDSAFTARVAAMLEQDGNRVEVVGRLPTDEVSAIEVTGKSIVLHGASRAAESERTLRLELTDVLARLRVQDLSNDTGAARSIQIKIDKLETLKPRARVTGYQRSVPAFLLMFMTINLLVAGANLAEDRAAGRLRRMFVAPVASVSIIGGMLLARVILAWIQTLVLIAVGVFLFHIRWEANPFEVAIFIAIYALAAGGIGLVIGTWFANPEQAHAAAVWLGIIIAPLSGLWWPTDSMSGLIQTISSLSPASWALHALGGMLAFGGSLGEAALASAGLLTIAAVAIGIAQWRLSARRNSTLYF